MDMTFTDPLSRPLHFTGRQKQLAFLLDKTRHRKGPRIIVVVGPPGIGKPALVSEFVHRQAKRKTLWLNVGHLRTLGDDLEDFGKQVGLYERDRAVTIVLDGLDEVDNFAEFSMRILAMRNFNSLIVTSRMLPTFPRTYILNLKGLTEKESIQLLYKIVGPERSTLRLFMPFLNYASGNPLVLITSAQLLKTHTPEQIAMQLQGKWGELFEPFVYNNKDIEVVAPKIIIANDALIYLLKQKPEDIHLVSPRKFEELIGELLESMGWEIQLTPQSKDGGKDILATLSTDIGKFLMLVEAKHYSPKRPVQVGLVRQLFGTFVDHGANSAMLVTSSHFTKGARAFQQSHEYQLSLADYSNVVSWIQKYETKSPKLAS